MAVHSFRSREGRLFIDNKLGGPLSLAQQAQIAALEATGVHVIAAQPGTALEAATITCAHCHMTFLRNPQRQRARGYCAKCHHYLCDSPTCNRDCRPMKRLLDELQEQFYQQGR
jgi:hypothetical protein